MVVQSSPRRLGILVALIIALVLVGQASAQVALNTCAQFEPGSFGWYLSGCWLVGIVEAFINGPSTPFLVIR